MARRRTGGREGEHSETLVFGDSRKPPEYGRVFLELLPRNLYDCTQTIQAGSQTAQQREYGKMACSLYVRVAAEAHSRVFVENIF